MKKLISYFMMLMVFIMTGFIASCNLLKDLNPDELDEQGNNTGGDFTKKTLETYGDLMDFIPEGIYDCDGGIYGNYILGRGNDGSFVFVNKTDAPVEVFFKDRYFYAQWFNLEHAWYKTEVYHQPETELYRSNFLTLIRFHFPSNLLAFISSDVCEKKPKSVTSDKVAGINVKHYVYEQKESFVSSFQEFWVMENGLCLKRKIYSVVAGNTIPQPLSDFTVTLTDTRPGDFKSILSKMPSINVGGNQPEKLPSYDNIHRYQFKDFSDKWRTDLYPRELDKWIKPYQGSGTIEFSVIYRYVKEMIERDNLVFKKFDFNAMDVWIPGAPHQDIKNYIKTQVMPIEHMKQIFELDAIGDGNGTYTWEGDNSGVVNISRPGEVAYYIQYKIICWGKNQYQITISVCVVVGV